MTAASVSSGGHDDGPAREWRDKLANRLHDAISGVRECYDSQDEAEDAVECFDLADALLPVVAGIVAGELRAAAESLRGQAVESFGWTIVIRERLNDRADEIDPA